MQYILAYQQWRNGAAYMTRHREMRSAYALKPFDNFVKSPASRRKMGLRQRQRMAIEGSGDL